jgi:hypothetical protein
MPPQFPGVLPPDFPAEDMWFVEPWAEEAHAIQQMGDAGGDEVDEAADPEPEETPIGAGLARWAAHGALLLLCCIRCNLLVNYIQRLTATVALYQSPVQVCA